MELNKKIEQAKKIASTNLCDEDCENCVIYNYCYSFQNSIMAAKAFLYDNGISCNGSLYDLLQRNYDAVVARGLITEETSTLEFIEKLKEEYCETVWEWVLIYKKENLDTKRLESELTDLMSVCSNFLIKLGKNPVEMLVKNCEKQEERAKNGI